MAATKTEATPGTDRLFELIGDLSYRQAPPGEHFVLASGATSTYFFDLKKTMLDPEGISLVADQVLRRVVAIGAHVVGGLAMGAVPIVVATLVKAHAAGYELRGFWVRKEQKDHGTKAKADGYLEPGAKVVIVEDVTTKGGSAMMAVNEARERGCEVTAVVTIVDRQEGAREFLSSEGIELIALYTRDQFLR
ncbi:MAG TPA: orotate phosphoribosyltransferase [Stellaceae bacterium]|nr:orotate phosphoribosyltransferase [Stellaceae bacterium]